MLVPLAVITSAVVLRPPIHPDHLLSAGLPPLCRRHATVAACAAEADADWGALDSWLSEGSHEPDSSEKALPRRPSREAVSAGHIHDHFYSNTASDWVGLGASAKLEALLSQYGYAHPSFPQAASFPMIVSGEEDALIASAPGTGKSLAYLAPIVERLRRIEAEEGPTTAGEVRAIVLVPSNELAQQVLDLARELANHTLRTTIVTGEHKWQTQCERLKGGVDLVVATTGRLIAHLDPRNELTPSFTLRGLRSLVVDEADALYSEASDSGPRDNWKWILEHLPAECAIALVSNTLPMGVEASIQKDLAPRSRKLQVWRGRGLHLTRPGIQAKLIEVVRDVDDPFEARLEELLPELAVGGRTLVLANTVATSARLHRSLQAWAQGLPERRRPLVLVVHESEAAREREAALEAFCAAAAEESDPTLAREGPVRVLVATARAMRGLNFGCEPSTGIAPPDHVACFDFPPDGQQYVKRLGFATRGDNPPGRVTLLALERQLPFAKKMLAYDAEGEPIGVEPHKPHKPRRSQRSELGAPM